jgi:hypothetical protein
MTGKQPPSDERPDEHPTEVRRIQTSLLSGKKRPPAEARDVRPGTGFLVAPWRLLVQIGHVNPTTVGLEVRDEIIIGRADPSQDFEPNLDLTPYGGREHGVSRRHAVIRQKEQHLFVEDLGSTNGTRLNGGELQPGRAYQLRDGDQVELGEIRLLIRFIQTPS